MARGGAGIWRDCATVVAADWSEMKGAGLLRILMSRETQARLGTELARLLGDRPYRLVAPDEEAEANQAQIAFISRDITGLSTKHEVLPHTQQAYDAMLRSTTLQWVHVHSAGADRPVYIALRERGVNVTTSPGANAQVVAQSAVLGLLALARHWPKLLAAQRERRWAPLHGGALPRDLQGQKAMVVGWGPIGQEIGRLLLAVGLRLVVVRRSGGEIGAGVECVAPDGLLAHLPRVDWLVLACPLTPQTRGLIGARELAALPMHAGLINVARGEVVHQPALLHALEQERLAGAYLDVFEHEPLPLESPLWTLPNVIATPHSAGASDGNEARVDRLFLDSFADRLRAQA